MYTYDTLSEALNDLQNRGYQHDFNLDTNQLTCPELDRSFQPSEFQVDEYYRFEGMSSTDDNAVIFAIHTNDGIKGTLLDAYGTYADAITPELAERLRIS